MAEDLDPQAGHVRVKITCPLKVIADVQALSAEVPALAGRQLMMPKTAPLICRLNAGKLIIHNDDGSDLIYLISKGVCEMRRGICAVMAWGIRVDEVNPEKTKKLLQEAEETVPTLTSPLARKELSDRIEFYRLILKNFSVA